MFWAVAPSRAGAADLRFQAQLVWGTDDPKPPEGKNFKPVEGDIRQKLKDLPLRWGNYFEVSRTNFDVALASSRTVAISEKCALEVKSLGGTSIEVTSLSKGKEVMKRKQSLPKGEVFVLGGNAPNATAWLVILKRLE